MIYQPQYTAISLADMILSAISSCKLFLISSQKLSGFDTTLLPVIGVHISEMVIYDMLTHLAEKMNAAHAIPVLTQSLSEEESRYKVCQFTRKLEFSMTWMKSFTRWQSWPWRIHRYKAFLIDNIGKPSRELAYSFYVLWICSHAYAMRRRKVLDDNEWVGWLQWMRNCFRKGTIKETWKQVEQDRWFNPNFQNFVNTEIVAGK